MHRSKRAATARRPDPTIEARQCGPAFPARYDTQASSHGLARVDVLPRKSKPSTVQWRLGIGDLDGHSYTEDDAIDMMSADRHNKVLAFGHRVDFGVPRPGDCPRPMKCSSASAQPARLVAAEVARASA